MAEASATMTWYPQAVEAVRRQFGAGLFKMGDAISNRAKPNSPVLTGTLRNSIRVEEEGTNTVVVRAGGRVGVFNIDYAEIREFHNRKHPATRYYMTRAFNETVSGDISRYFREVGQ